MMSNNFLHFSFSMVALTCILGSNIAMAGVSDSSISLNKLKTIKTAKKKVSQFVPGEIIVKFVKSVKSIKAKNEVEMLGLEVVKEFKILSNTTGHTYLLIRSKNKDTQELLNEFKKRIDVEYVEPNYIYNSQKTPNDPYFNQLWGQHNTGQTGGLVGADINAPEAWDRSTGSNNVVIAVIDTGVDYLHEDLQHNMWINQAEIPNNGIDDDHNGYIDDVFGINAVNNSGDPMDKLSEDGGHGTHVAGTIAAVGNNGKGVVGVSWNARIMALKFLSTGGGTSTDAVKCLEYVLEQKNKGVNIVATNNSWGGGGASQTVKDIIKATNDAGIVFVAAAGNDGSNNDTTPHYPSSYDLSGVISVASTDDNDDLSSFSNYGTVSVDLAAPGSSILSTTPRIGAITYNIFFDNMESGMSNWTTGGVGDAWALSEDQEIFANPDFPVPSPTHFLSDSPGTPYASDTNNWVMLAQNLDLSSYVGIPIYVGFGAAVYIEADYDNATVEVSGDNGQTWSILYNFTGYANYWDSYNFEIPESVKTDQFRLRFHLASDDSVEYDGWLIDDVGIGAASEMQSQYGYKSGTSMATPQVSGALALAAAVCPANQSVATMRQNLFDSVDVLSSLSGKLLTEGRLNVEALLEKCPTSPFAVKSDFNADNHSDILWKKSGGGHTVWTMNENGKEGIIDFAVPNSKAKGIGDFDGNGVADVLWQLAQDSHVLWLMNANGTHTEVDIGAPALKAKGVADFNNDGKADIIWEKPNGSYLIWYMDANGKTGELFVGGRDFTFEKTGDFNDDGISDILMTTSKSTRVIWFMGLNGRTSAKLIGAKDFGIDDVADFSGDGIADILLQSNATGIHFVWVMSANGTKTAIVPLGAKTLTAVATGDYDGDGKADILWKDGAGSHNIWTIDANGKKGDIAVGADGWSAQP